MNNYLFAYYENKKINFKEIPAKSLADFKNKFVRWAFDKWDFVESEEYNTLIQELNLEHIYISEIKELDV